MFSLFPIAVSVGLNADAPNRKKEIGLSGGRNHASCSQKPSVSTKCQSLNVLPLERVDTFQMDTKMKPIALNFVVGAMIATPTLAAHNNPRAGPEDTAQTTNHDANQEKSIGTAGEDEMNGQSDQDANTTAGGGQNGNRGHGAGGSS
ncbi:MAG: hypothetical protein WBV62_05320 [Roseobacter sp.]